MKGKNKRKQRHDCSKKKSELGSQSALASDYEDSNASFNLSQMPERDQTIENYDIKIYHDDKAGPVTSKFYAKTVAAPNFTPMAQKIGTEA